MSKTDFDRIAGAWLAEGPTELNDRVLDAALDEVHLTHQRRRRAVPWRTPILNTPIRLAAAIAIVVVAGIAGLNLYLGGGVGSPTPSPFASPTPTASPTAPPSSAPTATNTATRTFPPAAAPLTAGPYRAGAPFLLPNMTFDVPAGWNAWDGTETNVISMEIDSPTQSGSTGAFVNLEVPVAVYADPCLTGSTVKVPNLGPTVDDFVAAVTKLPKFSAGPVTDVLIGGLPGKQFDLTNSIPSNGTGCTGENALIHVWSTAYNVGGDTMGGLRQHVVVVDVHGTRFVVDVLYTDPSGPIENDVNAIITSIRFE